MLRPESRLWRNGARACPRTWSQKTARALPLRPSAYQALAFAVRHEEWAFRHLSYAAAQASDPEIMARAEALAQDALAHLAGLRQARRRAFHAERSDGATQTNDAPLPLTREALRQAALTRERRLLARLDRLPSPTPGVAQAQAITSALVEELREPAANGTEPAATGTEPAATGTPAPEPTARTLSPAELRIELDRSFALYDRAVTRTEDAAALALAQALAAATVARLAALVPEPAP